MTPELDALDRQRMRWSAARAAFNLVPHLSGEASFAVGGLGARVPELSARITVLPVDPAALKITFDSQLMDWWTSDHPDPILGQPMRWGSDRKVANDYVIWGHALQPDDWYRYIALHRSGAVDVGLSTEAGMQRDDRTFVFLTTTVGRIWAASEMFRLVSARFALSAPIEVAVGIRDTSGAHLSAFSEGWDENYDRRAGRRCVEPALFMRRELLTLGDSWPKDVAHDLGRQIENAFGSTSQRFLAGRGPHKDEIDPRLCLWD